MNITLHFGLATALRVAQHGSKLKARLYDSVLAADYIQATNKVELQLELVTMVDSLRSGTLHD